MACLKEEGKQPCWNDKLAKVQIMSEKTSEQDLSNEVGMKSICDDLGGSDCKRLNTSALVTGCKWSMSAEPVNEGSMELCEEGMDDSLSVIACLILTILSEK
jgi:hypothetical protein